MSDECTHPLTISMIVAHDLNRGIGFKNGLPWKIPGDLAYFKEMTGGCPLVMGSNTAYSLGRVLPGRPCHVVSSKPCHDLIAQGFVIHSSLEEALEVAGDEARKMTLDGAVFVIGGAKVYEQALPFVHRLYVTEVNTVAEVDTYFPPYKDLPFVISHTGNQQPASMSHPSWRTLIYTRTSGEDQGVEP